MRRIHRVFRPSSSSGAHRLSQALRRCSFLKCSGDAALPPCRPTGPQCSQWSPVVCPPTAEEVVPSSPPGRTGPTWLGRSPLYACQLPTVLNQPLRTPQAPGVPTADSLRFRSMSETSRSFPRSSLQLVTISDPR
ncbi:hypothetical protein NDU88_003546 [Pleurodeles waltl]|uniref:Uncharacterized protein n=1 Tax=Pleurodeles waltl TaxID=8319 RepID=A0AAV7UEG1_PLEWA|nr:hypothetical protein NDU88_003546 [Pleurodeles waltl]